MAWLHVASLIVVSPLRVLGREPISLLGRLHTSNCGARNQDRNHPYKAGMCHVCITKFNPQLLELFPQGAGVMLLLLPTVKLWAITLLLFLQQDCPVDPSAILELMGWRSLRGTEDSYCSISHLKIFFQDQENEIPEGEGDQYWAWLINVCPYMTSLAITTAKIFVLTKTLLVFAVEGNNTWNLSLFEDPATIHRMFSAIS